jgi:predicted LPLAT superfamily acyltransferase
MAGVQNRFTFSFDGEEYLMDMIREGRGGLLISAHLGNWEIAGFLLKRLETKINIVMYDAEHQKIKEGLEKFTGGRNANIIVVKDDLSHIYAMHDALDRNELVCMHADRFVAGAKTISLAFLGEAARFPAGPFQVASMFKVPVSFTYAIKQGSLHYALSATRPRIPSREEGRFGYESLARAYVDSLEEKARQYPEQWYNYYHFWKA